MIGYTHITGAVWNYLIDLRVEWHRNAMIAEAYGARYEKTFHSHMESYFASVPY